MIGFSANELTVIKILDNYIEFHGVARSFRINRARCLIGEQVYKFCKKNKIDLILALVNDHRAMKLIERLNDTIQHHLACVTAANKDTNFVNSKTSLKSII